MFSGGIETECWAKIGKLINLRWCVNHQDASTEVSILCLKD